MFHGALRLLTTWENVLSIYEPDTVLSIGRRLLNKINIFS